MRTYLKYELVQNNITKCKRENSTRAAVYLITYQQMQMRMLVQKLGVEKATKCHD